MIAFTLDGINDRIDLFEFVTANKVYEYHDKKSLPTGKQLHVLVCFLPFYNAGKASIGEKLTSWLNVYLPAFMLIMVYNTSGNYAESIQINMWVFLMDSII